MLHPQPQEPARAPTTGAVGDAGRPLPRGPPPPTRPEAQQAPLSRGRDPAMPDGEAAPGGSQGITAARMSPPAQPRATAGSLTSRLSRRILAAAGSPSDPGQPAAGRAGAGPPRPGPPDLATEDVSQDLLDTDCRAEGHQRALTSAPVAPVARPPAPASQPLATQTQNGAEASAPPTGDHPPEGPTLDGCAVCRVCRFHDLLGLATLRGNVVAVDAGTTRTGMAMAGVVQSGPEAYQSQVASGVGTS